ncbi:NAD(P)-dependent oxidoreductase [Frondihabitans peucedani]|uniref:NAD-dependent epimerase/dehydratase domain-containing protein n=1 Tax=Frondihabitans peucedani TaxID=598626 RepID=A0ABP8E7A1_9MICO
MTRLVVVGSTGFIGSRVVEAARLGGLDVVGVSRSAPDRPPVSRPVDLSDTATLRDVFAGADAVVLSAAYVGTDEQEARRTNADGVRSAVTAALHAGVPRLVSVSTASVVGPGPHRDAAARTDGLAPQSAASRTRAEAESIVLGAGGVVLRPNLVYGAGDRWVVPGLARLIAAGDEAGRSSALVSTIHVRDLARAVVGAAEPWPPGLAGTVRNANAPDPDRMSAVVATLRWVLGLDRVTSDAGAGREGRHGAAGLTPHQRSLILVDNWFESASLWRDLGLPAPRGFSLDAADTEWYRRHLLDRI